MVMEPYKDPDSVRKVAEQVASALQQEGIPAFVRIRHDGLIIGAF